MPYFIYTSVPGLLGCFKHLLTIVNNAAVNVSVQIPVCGFVFTSFVYISEVELLSQW